MYMYNYITSKERLNIVKNAFKIICEVYSL